jgi:hypothetical protein
MVNTPHLCPACDDAQHMFCDGAGQCECDLCVPYELRGAGAQRSSRQVLGGLVVAAAIIVLSVLMCRLAHAQVTGSDFCQGQNPAKSSVAISITSSGAGEHQLVAAVANQAIQVCSFTYDLGGTSPTAEFDYGTQVSTACDTGANAMTGAMSSTTRTVAGPLDYFTAPAGNALCLKLGGTSPTAVGVLTYVQK